MVKLPRSNAQVGNITTVYNQWEMNDSTGFCVPDVVGSKDLLLFHTYHEATGKMHFFAYGMDFRN